MKRPLFIFAFIFSLGIAAQEALKINFIPLVLLSGFCLFFHRKIFIFGALFFLGMAVSAWRHQPDNCDIARLINFQPGEYLVKGFVCSPPENSGGKTEFIFCSRQVQYNGLHQSCCGNIFVRLSASEGISYGDSLILNGSLQRPRKYFSRGKVSADMRVKIFQPVEIKKSLFLSARRFSFYLREEFTRRIRRYLGGISAGVIEAMVLGRKDNLPKHLYQAMVRTGTVHILVVSGLNVGIVVLMVDLVLKIFRFPRKLRLALALLFSLFYCLVTGASTPIVRATVMSGVFLVSYLFQRQPDIYNSLGLSALLILGFDPGQLSNIGFQLSFASVLAIAFIYPRIKVFLRMNHYRNKLLKFISENTLVSLSAWLGTVGFIAYYFKFFSPVTVLANLFIVPLASLITFCGFSLVAVSLIFPPAAALFAASAKLVVFLLLALNSILLSLPLASFSWG